jgi:hypothetical protein
MMCVFCAHISVNRSWPKFGVSQAGRSERTERITKQLETECSTVGDSHIVDAPPESVRVMPIRGSNLEHRNLTKKQKGVQLTGRLNADNLTKITKPQEKCHMIDQRGTALIGPFRVSQRDLEVETSLFTF